MEQQGEDWADVHIFVYLGICEAEMRNDEQAKIEFNRALEHYPTTPEAHYGLAKIYSKNGDHINAKEHLLLAIENLRYKREDPYNEYLNEITSENIQELKSIINNQKAQMVDQIVSTKIDLE